MDDLAIVMKAVLLVQLQLLRPAEEREKPEVVLSRAGFRNDEIARFLGKTTAAVQRSIHRSR